MGNLSLVIITLDEEHNIERCIRSVPFAKEVIVVDSGSKDKTKQVAETLGAKFVYNEWKSFGAQKKFAAQLASCEWVLSLDADEWLSEDLQDEIKLVIDNDGWGRNIFKIKRMSRFLGRWIKHGGWYPDWQTRFYRKTYAEWNESETIHETLKVKETPSKLYGIMYHTPFDSIKDQVDSNFRYAKLLAEKKLKEGVRIRNPLLIVIKTISKFLENYIIKSGWMDGTAGFVIAINSAHSYMIQMYTIYVSSKKELKDV
jgi:glycosyltransferase involved in cell wall biosynthesis